MPLTLTVDSARWRKHHAEVLDAFPGIIPVTKGNGYGFGNARLAAEAEKLGVATVAVGTYAEIPDVRAAFSGNILVLTPWRPGAEFPRDERLIHTVSRAEDLERLSRTGASRVVVELLTTMRRHGIPAAGLGELAERLAASAADPANDVRLEGWALHLPLADSGSATSHINEVHERLQLLHSAGLEPATLYVSHLSAGELAHLRTEQSHLTIQPRIGTALWLGDRDAYRAHATVLDVHPVRRGDRFGYRQRRVPGEGHVIVVAGGTAHGIALSAPSHVGSLRERARTLAHGGLQAAGRALSPYVIGGRRRWFAEPPHMQVSLLFLPASVTAPAVGDEVEVKVGMTMTNFDRTLFG